jgi:hypothetical protein
MCLNSEIKLMKNPGHNAGYELITYNARNKIKKSNEKAMLFPQILFHNSTFL